VGRPARKLHEIKPVRKMGRAYVHWNGKDWSLGPWNARDDCPSDAAEEKLAKLKALWRIDPMAGCDADSKLLFVELWRDWRQSEQAPGDRRGELTRCQQLLFGSSESPGPYIDAPASAFDAADLLAWQSSLCRLTGRNGDLRFGRYCVERFVSLVCQCFEWGVVAGKVEQSQAACLRLVRPPARGRVREPVHRGSVEFEEVERVAAKLRSAAGDVLRLMWWTGARPSELCRLRRKDVVRSPVLKSKKGATVPIGELGVWAAPLAKHKTSRHGLERVIFFGPKSIPIIEPRLSGSPEEPIFSTSSGSQYDSKSLRDYVKKCCDSNGWPRWSPYQIDHAFLCRVQAAFSSDMPGTGPIAAKAARGQCPHPEGPPPSPPLSRRRTPPRTRRSWPAGRRRRCGRCPARPPVRCSPPSRAVRRPARPRPLRPPTRPR